MKGLCRCFLILLLTPLCVWAESGLNSGAVATVQQVLSGGDLDSCSLESNPREFQRQLQRGAAQTEKKSKAYSCKKNTTTEKECTACCERACIFYVCGKPFVNLACKGLCYLTDCSTKP